MHKCHCNFFKALLGQGWVLQCLLRWLSPLQNRPPLLGYGLLHFLYCNCRPPPHDLVHSVQLLQSPNPPFTEKVEEKKAIYNRVLLLSLLFSHDITSVSMYFFPFCKWVIRQYMAGRRDLILLSRWTPILTFGEHRRLLLSFQQCGIKKKAFLFLLNCFFFFFFFFFF